MSEKGKTKATSPKSKKLVWTPEEDEILRNSIKEQGARILENGITVINGSWGGVARQLPGRSAKQCRERWCYNLAPSINRSLWSLEEDAILIKAQQKLGNSWALISRQLNGRTENSVKIRFKSIMRASKRHWSARDDRTLLSLYRKYGSKWDVIAEALPGRTRNAVKTRCLMLRKKVVDEEPEPGAPEQILRHPEYLDRVDLRVSRDSLEVIHHPASGKRKAATVEEKEAKEIQLEAALESPRKKKKIDLKVSVDDEEQQQPGQTAAPAPPVEYGNLESFAKMAVQSSTGLPPGALGEEVPYNPGYPIATAAQMQQLLLNQTLFSKYQQAATNALLQQEALRLGLLNFSPTSSLPPSLPPSPTNANLEFPNNLLMSAMLSNLSTLANASANEIKN